MFLVSKRDASFLGEAISEITLQPALGESVIAELANKSVAAC